MKRQNSGFTLTEFLIVLIMIGILATLAVPNFFSMRNQAKNAETRNTLRNFQLCADDYGVMYDGVYAIDGSLVIEVAPASYRDPVTKRMRNAITRKFTEPSNIPAPGAINYSSDGSRYNIVAFDHKGDTLAVAFSGK